MPRANAITRFENMGEVLEQLGGISPRRVRMHPTPGTATEKDLLKILDHTDVACELVDGVLVEKAVGFAESSLACEIIKLLGNYLDDHDLGFLAGEQGNLRLDRGLVRGPDVSFISWDQQPDRCLPNEPLPELVPDLAIEVLSQGNTPGEMERKRREYFLSGTKLVWMVDPVQRNVSVYTAPDEFTVFTEADTLDGGNVLPGLALPVGRIFKRLRAALLRSGQEEAKEEARRVGPARIGASPAVATGGRRCAAIPQPLQRLGL